ncbi:hypothetical protein CC79DRAFT_1359803 [Sarocladium strictum]
MRVYILYLLLSTTATDGYHHSHGCDKNLDSSAKAKRTATPHPEREALFKRLVEAISQDESDVQRQGQDAHPLAKRQDAATQVTRRPTARPTYASSCANSSKYASACSCLGVKPTTTTAARPTSTTTVVRTVTPSTMRIVTKTNTLSRTASTTIQRTTTTTVRASTTVRTTVTATATVFVDPPPPPPPRCKSSNTIKGLEGTQSCKCCWDTYPVTSLLTRQYWMDFLVFDLDMCVQLCDNYRGRCKGVDFFGDDDDDMSTCRMYQDMSDLTEHVDVFYLLLLQFIFLLYFVFLVFIIIN